MELNMNIEERVDCDMNRQDEKVVILIKHQSADPMQTCISYTFVLCTMIYSFFTFERQRLVGRLLWFRQTIVVSVVEQARRVR